MILNFGTAVDLVLDQNGIKEQISIGPYSFSRQNYLHLIEYVTQGGFPGWSDDIAPDYVLTMQEAVALNRRKK